MKPVDEQLALIKRGPAEILVEGELRAKLDASRPETLGQASRIEGMTPAALTLILAASLRSPRRGTA